MCVSMHWAEANPDAKRLYDDLLSHYNRLIRPVSNNSEVVTVRLGLHLSQLIDLVRLFPRLVILHLGCFSFYEEKWPPIHFMCNKLGGQSYACVELGLWHELHFATMFTTLICIHQP